jgi:hypothetical protein
LTTPAATIQGGQRHDPLPALAAVRRVDHASGQVGDGEPAGLRQDREHGGQRHLPAVGLQEAQQSAECHFANVAGSG